MYRTAIARQKRNKKFCKKLLMSFRKFKKSPLKFAAVMLVITISAATSNISSTNAFYNDAENSSGNSFFAGFLDFQLTNNNLGKIIGPEALGEVLHSSVAMPEGGSLAMQYVLNTLITTAPSNVDFCNSIMVEAKDNGNIKYAGPIAGLSSATTTEFGTWEFRFDLPPSVSVPHGAKCDASAVFSAWREDTANQADSGWRDEEILNISFTSRMVVLNEIFANPNENDKEFIEIYNNGSTDVDVAGWKLSEISGSDEKFYTISPTAGPLKATSENGSTIIPTNGFLVLYLSSSIALNNGGDTVKLYDNSSTLLDAHKYPAVVAGKSVVRFPDGIGFWVDPEPTPGASNMVTLEDLKIAGFDDFMIAKALELASLKNITILTSVESGENQIQDVATATSTTENMINDSLGTTIADFAPSFVEPTPEIASENAPTASPPDNIETASTTPEVIPDIEVAVATPEEIIDEPVEAPVLDEVIASEPERAVEPEPAVESAGVAEPEPIIIEEEPI